MKLLELGIVMSLISITANFSYITYNNIFSKIDAYNEKIKIIKLIENTNSKISFDLENKKIVSDEKTSLLNSKFSYTSNNISDKFERRFNDKNFDKGFTIYIKKNNKSLEKIVYNTANSLNMPLLSDNK